MHLEDRGRGRRAAGCRSGCATRDPLYEQAVEIVVREGRGSVSLLQRALGIGYGRAARLIDFMAEDGIVGTLQRQPTPARCCITPEQWAQMRGTVEAGDASE